MTSSFLFFLSLISPLFSAHALSPRWSRDLIRRVYKATLLGHQLISFRPPDLQASPLFGSDTLHFTNETRLPFDSFEAFQLPSMGRHTTTRTLRLACVIHNVKPNELHCKRLYHRHVCLNVHVFHNCQTTEVGDESTQKNRENVKTNRAEKETLLASTFSPFHLPSYKNDHVFHNSQTTEVGDKSTQKKPGRMQRTNIAGKKRLYLPSAFSLDLEAARLL
ncbi:hypothetical protein AVEN_261025-1 [Araneus ventricosus]|uniref:Uncharacterized protein n=1 Tax=Araneus ventricosus TaxID=182803 RepID=A0A4Y2UC27_ARAVE|nr:hypothetical protein AVEN_261025-1 [Araneus ventricosus]